MRTTTTTTTTVVTTSDEEPHPFGDSGTVGQRSRWIAAGFSLVAAGIHFGFAPGHYAEDWRHGLFFMLLGWFQLVWAVMVVTKPDKKLLWSGIVVSAVTIGVWAVSRTVGLPTFVGGEGRESMTLADQLSSLLEGAIIVFSAALLSSPAWVRQPVKAREVSTAVSTAVVALALVAGSMSLTPHYTSGHSHGGAGHDHGASTDHDAEHASGVSTDEHSAEHGAGAATDEHSADHAGTAAATDGTATVGTAASTEHAHAETGPWPTGTSPCEQAQAKFPTDQGEDSDPTAGHNHHGALVDQPIDDATRQELIAQQKEARAVIDRYPTVADATADGYKLSTVYLPCIGAHYTKVSLVGEFDPSTPSELLYDGTAPDSKILGLSYLLVHPGGAPEGFAGPNDVWHQHSANGGLCLNAAGVVIGGEQMSKATCEGKGGHKSGLKDIWMVHDWVAPGWECSWGVFAAECPELGGRPGGTSASPLS